jgi:hypothetical protein
VLFLPGTYFLGRRLAAGVEPGRSWRQGTLAIMSAIAVWLTAVQLAANLTGSFVAALWIGAVTTGIAGYLVRPKAAPEAATAPDGRRTVLLAFVAAAPILLAGLGGYFHDELFVTQHLAMIREFQNGPVPIRNLADPQQLMRYHYGFNIVCAALTAWFRISAPLAIDLTTATGWALSWLLLCMIGERLSGGKSSGRLTAWITLFGGGLVWMISPWWLENTWPEKLSSMVSTGSQVYVNPPLVSYIFQHPYSLGIPMALAVTYAAIGSDEVPDRRGDYLLVPLLASLSLIQSTLFIALAASLAFDRIVIRRNWFFVPCIVVVGALAVAMGGMFLRSGGPASSFGGIYFRVWLLEDKWIRCVAWNLLTYGALLPLGAIGLFLLPRRGRWIIATQALGGFVIPNVLKYEHSWDIVKFATGAQLFLGISTAFTLERLRSAPSRLLKVAANLSIPIVTLSSIFYLGVVFYAEWYSGHPGRLAVQPVQLNDEQERCAAWLRREMSPLDVAYCRPEPALGYVQRAGIPATAFNISAPTSFGLSRENIEARRKLVVEGSDDLAEYAKFGISWFIVEPGDEMMERKIARWESQGLVQLRNQFGPIRVYSVRRS